MLRKIAEYVHLVRPRDQFDVKVDEVVRQGHNNNDPEIRSIFRNKGKGHKGTVEALSRARKYCMVQAERYDRMRREKERNMDAFLREHQGLQDLEREAAISTLSLQDHARHRLHLIAEGWRANCRIYGTELYSIEQVRAAQLHRGEAARLMSQCLREMERRSDRTEPARALEEEAETQPGEPDSDKYGKWLDGAEPPSFR